MENSVRSERTRSAVIQAALQIIRRDGPARLTMDALAKESGISKGGVMHQFPNKDSVLLALLDHQIAHFDGFAQAYRDGTVEPSAEPLLESQIVTLREALRTQDSVAVALMAVYAHNPRLLADQRVLNQKLADEIVAEASDPDLAMIRCMAAFGLALTGLFGLCPIDPDSSDRLFHRLLDAEAWRSLEKT